MKILGVMIGSSLDGIDMSLIELKENHNRISHEFLKSQEVELQVTWKNRILAYRDRLESLDFPHDLDTAFAHYLSPIIERFIGDLHCDYIPYHGPTISHRPSKGKSWQLGNGKILAENLGLPVLDNWRESDIQAGGQGAPLAPIVDKYLFGAFDACINLGGIVNISYQKGGHMFGYDLTGCNQVLNLLAGRAGLAFDENGRMARNGGVIPKLLQELDSWDYCVSSSPKSLSNASVEQFFTQKLNAKVVTISDGLHTMTAHICNQIILAVPVEAETVLLTGGGAKNEFLVELLRSIKPDIDWIVPIKELIDFKECLLMSLMAYLRIGNKINVFSTVTGAEHDTLAGRINFP